MAQSTRTHISLSSPHERHRALFRKPRAETAYYPVALARGTDESAALLVLPTETLFVRTPRCRRRRPSHRLAAIASSHDQAYMVDIVLWSEPCGKRRYNSPFAARIGPSKEIIRRAGTSCSQHRLSHCAANARAATTTPRDSGPERPGCCLDTDANG